MDANSLKDMLKKTMTDKPTEKKAALKLPEIFSFFDNNKNWTIQGNDITDYFNYGFTAETFKCYSQKVKNLFKKLEKNSINTKPNGDPILTFDDKAHISHGGTEIIDEDIAQHLEDPNIFNYPITGFLDAINQQYPEISPDIKKNIEKNNASVENVYGLKRGNPPPVNIFPEQRPPNPFGFNPYPPGPGQMRFPPPQAHMHGYPPSMPMMNPMPHMPPPGGHMSQMGYGHMNPMHGQMNPMMYPPGNPGMPGYGRMMPGPEVMKDKKPEKRKKSSSAESNNESKEKDDDKKSHSRKRSSSKHSDKKKKSRSREKKHKSRKSKDRERKHEKSRSRDKDRDRDHKKDKDRKKDRSRDKSRSRDKHDRKRDRDDRERKDKKRSSSRDDRKSKKKYDDDNDKPSKSGTWQTKLINDTIGSQDNRDRKKDKEKDKYRK